MARQSGNRQNPSSFLPTERERSIFTEEVPIVDLIVVELASEFHAVRANHFREVVLELKGVVKLLGCVSRYAENRSGELLRKCDVRDALELWSNRCNSAIECRSIPGRRNKSKGGQCDGAGHSR